MNERYFPLRNPSFVLYLSVWIYQKCAWMYKDVYQAFKGAFLGKDCGYQKGQKYIICWMDWAILND